MKLKLKMKHSVKPYTAKRSVVLNSSGFTMIELVVALAISVVIVAAAGFILLTQSGVIRLTRSVSTEQQRLNVAVSTVRYSFRMAGFDYGQKYFIQSGAVPPVQIVKPEYPANPYEILVSYVTLIDGSNPCTLIPVSKSANAASAEFDLSKSCNINSFRVGQMLDITNPIPLDGSPLPAPPIIFCVTSIQKNPNMIQMNPGKGGICAANPVPPKSIGGGNVSLINQILFYWGNITYKFNPPFDIPGNLYKCTVNPVVLEPPVASSYTAPICVANTTVILSDYINNFNVSALPNQNIYGQPYAYDISVTGESNVALSDSPSYSIHVPYNSNPNGADAKGNAGQIVGNNVLKVLNSNVFLRNVYYGR
jgi:prepilin-type N-terminal cleavage/methylation domain-containing protein